MPRASNAPRPMTYFNGSYPNSAKCPGPLPGATPRQHRRRHTAGALPRHGVQIGYIRRLQLRPPRIRVRQPPQSVHHQQGLSSRTYYIAIVQLFQVNHFPPTLCNLYFLRSPQIPPKDRVSTKQQYPSFPRRREPRLHPTHHPKQQPCHSERSEESKTVRPIPLPRFQSLPLDGIMEDSNNPSFPRRREPRPQPTRPSKQTTLSF